MGRIKGGIHGKVSGKVSNAVFYESKGIQMVRSKPVAGSKNFSEAQEANQTNFGIKQNWLSPISAFLQIGCRNNIPHMGGPALAMQYLSANAVSGKGQDTVVHSEKMKVSMGDLSGTANASAVLDSGEIVFSWDPSTDFNCSTFDQVLALAYNVQEGKAIGVLKGVFRKQGILRLPVDEPGIYHCYLGFVAEDSSRQSDSQYLGIVTR